MAACSLGSDEVSLPVNLLFMMAQMFSIGFKSGELPDWRLKYGTQQSSSHPVTYLAEWQAAPACINTFVLHFDVDCDRWSLNNSD